MKHKKILQAWLDGKTVEFLSYSKEWITLQKIDEVDTAPGFIDDMEYRIKPENKFVFFHTEFSLSKLKGKEWLTDNIAIFDYPYYKPSGAHFMLEINPDNKIVSGIFCPNSHVNQIFTRED